MRANPITLTDIASYFTIYGITSIETRDDYIYFIQILDAVWLGWMLEKYKPPEGIGL